MQRLKKDKQLQPVTPYEENSLEQKRIRRDSQGQESLETQNSKNTAKNEPKLTARTHQKTLSAGVRPSSALGSVPKSS